MRMAPAEDLGLERVSPGNLIKCVLPAAVGWAWGKVWARRGLARSLSLGAVNTGAPFPC